MPVSPPALTEQDFVRIYFCVILLIISATCAFGAPFQNLADGTDPLVNLSWSASPEANAQYFVYRSTSGLSGTFSRLTAAPISGLTYADASPPSGQKLYQVRALNLVPQAAGPTQMSAKEFS